MRKSLALTLILVLVTSVSVLNMLCAGAHALTFPKSSEVALVPYSTSNYGGRLYTGIIWPNNDSFAFYNLTVADIANGEIADPIAVGGYDTLVLMAMDFDFEAAWGDSDFSSRILSFVNGGGKLIIYTSETPNATTFSNFVYPFTVDTPGQTGSRGGNLTNFVDDTLSSSNAADVPPSTPGAYINLTMITSQTDAVGDLTVMTSYDSHWYIDVFGTNIHNVGGPAHTYAFYGSGLIIFNGLDLDSAAASSSPSNANGGAAINMMWWRELCSQSLGAGPNVNGLTLDPSLATNIIGTTHTVTATVRNIQNSNPIAGVTVNFTITTGPNTGLTGQEVTDASGQVTFSWNGSMVGTDVLSATISNSNLGDPDIITTATKIWVKTLPLAVNLSPSSWIMDVGQNKLFTTVPSGGSGNYTGYLWYLGGVSQNGETASTFSFAPVSTGSYLIVATVTDDSNTTSPQSNVASVTVNAAPTVSIAPVGPLTLSFNQTQIFTATASGGSGTIRYQWYVDGRMVGAGGSSYAYVGSGSSANITCEVTDSASIPFTSASNAVYVTANPAPNPPAAQPIPTPAQSPTPIPTLSASPDQYSPPMVLSLSFGWLEIAILVMMCIIVGAVLVAAFRSFSEV